MKRLALLGSLLLAVVLLLPLMASQLPASQEELFDDLYGHGDGAAIHYRQDEVTAQSVGSWSQSVVSARFTELETIQPQTWLIQVRSTKGLEQNSAGVWQYDVTVDGVVVPGCTFRLQTFAAGGFLQNMITYPYYSSECSVEAPAFGTHTVGIVRTVASGTPSVVSQSVTVITIDRQEFVQFPMDINITTAVDLYVPILFWGGLLLFFLVKKAVFPAIFATIMLVNGFLSDPPVTFAWGVLFGLIAVWLHMMVVNGLLPGGKKDDKVE